MPKGPFKAGYRSQFGIENDLLNNIAAASALQELNSGGALSDQAASQLPAGGVYYAPQQETGERFMPTGFNFGLPGGGNGQLNLPPDIQSIVAKLMAGGSVTGMGAGNTNLNATEQEALKALKDQQKKANKIGKGALIAGGVGGALSLGNQLLTGYNQGVEAKRLKNAPLRPFFDRESQAIIQGLQQRIASGRMPGQDTAERLQAQANADTRAAVERGAGSVTDVLQGAQMADARARGAAQQQTERVAQYMQGQQDRLNAALEERGRQRRQAYFIRQANIAALEAAKRRNPQKAFTDLASTGITLGATMLGGPLGGQLAGMGTNAASNLLTQK